MNFLLSLLLAAFAIVGLSSTSSEAFQITQQPRSSTSNFSSSGLHSQNCDDDGRRAFLSRSAAFAMSVLVGGTCFGQPAAASYTAYARREEDWKERAEKGEVNYSNAQQLRAQLRDIAPMNDDGRSKIFCPNGTSSAVSPLMENKCGDRQALPSVFGRTDDAMGNSVPGFGGPSPSALRAELDAQAYFRSN